MSNLVVVDDDWRAAALAAQHACDAIAAIGNDARTAAEVCGDQRVEGKLRDFASAWEDARESLAGGLGTLGNAIEAALAAFTKVDDQGAAAMRGDG